jgi:hypothetical protein
MSNFGLVRSFGIDSGELDDLRPQECFVLGYELALIDNLLKSDEPICRTVYAANAPRIEKSCADEGRPCRLTWQAVDPSETWMLLTVPPRS